MQKKAWKKNKIPPPRESPILKSILDAANFRRDVELWRQNTGAAKFKNKDGSWRTVKFGEKGQADLTGVLVGYGTRIEVEVKRPGRKQSADQARFGERMEKLGCIYMVVTSPQDFIEKLEQAKKDHKNNMMELFSIS